MRLFHWILKRMSPAEAGREGPDDLRLAGLDEEMLRRMDPDDRVEALERVGLDPYDYIYLAC